MATVCPSRLQAEQGAGDLPLHIRLHVQDGGDRGGHHQARRRLLRLLRRALPRGTPSSMRRCSQSAWTNTATAWLLNTGWVGGARGGAVRSNTLGQLSMESTKRSVRLSSRSIPSSGSPTPRAAEVPPEILNPASSWADRSELKRRSASSRRSSGQLHQVCRSGHARGSRPGSWGAGLPGGVMMAKHRHWAWHWCRSGTDCSHYNRSLTEQRTSWNETLYD